MSGAGTRTKKVTTYGRKKTQIIAVHTDFTPLKPDAPLRSPLSDISFDSPPVKSRPPLQAKLCQDEVTRHANILAPTTRKVSKPTKAPVRPALSESPPSSPESERIVLVKPRKVYGGRRRIIRSPSSSTDTPPSRKLVFDGVELPTRRSRDTGLNLAERLARVTIDEKPTREKAERISHPTNELLSVCSSSDIVPFPHFLQSANLLNLIPASTNTTNTNSKLTTQKIGEASYSEVYGISRDDTEVVIKVIPLLDDVLQIDDEDELPDCSSFEDVVREIVITRRMTGINGAGFVDFLGAFVVKGLYPEDLLEQWDTFSETYGTESVRPDAFDQHRRYAVIVLSDGGDDLEAFKFDNTTGWVQAAGVFWQVADALARAEDEARFEHRDLHQGQVLIAHIPTASSRGIVDYLSSASCGVQTTIIDFGLSRLNGQDEATWTAIPDDVFDGVGEQWDVYRAMRDTVQDDWAAYHPITNVMWLHYILGYILHSKTLRKPRVRTETKHGNVASFPLRPARRIPLVTKTVKKVGGDKEGKQDRAERACRMLHEVLETLASCVDVGGSGIKKRGAKRGGQRLMSSRDIVEWGREMGWLC